MKTSNAFSHFVSCAAGNFLALLLVTSVAKAQPCPDSTWQEQQPQAYTIPNTNCILDLYFCQRDILNQFGVLLRREYYLWEVDVDPSSGGDCDSVQGDVLIRQGVDAMFMIYPLAADCESYSKVVSVYRKNCWRMFGQQACATCDPSRGVIFVPQLTGCDDAPLCVKTCLVCYDRPHSINRTRDCTFSTDYGNGNPMRCAALPPVWQLNTCYYISCE